MKSVYKLIKEYTELKALIEAKADELERRVKEIIYVFNDTEVMDLLNGIVGIVDYELDSRGKGIYITYYHNGEKKHHLIKDECLGNLSKEFKLYKKLQKKYGEIDRVSIKLIN